MFVLRGVASRYVRERRVRVHDLRVHQLLQRADMSGEMFLKPFAAESQRAVVLLDSVEKGFRLVLPKDWLVRGVEVKHVVTAVDVVGNVALSC